MLWDFTVSLNDGYTIEDVSNVVQVSISSGRQSLLDNFSSTRATVTVRYFDSATNPLTLLKPGTNVYIVASNSPSTPMEVFDGYISDVSVAYGIPFNDTTDEGNADILTIQCEGALARLARASGNNYAMAADTVANQMAAMALQTNVNYWLPTGGTPALQAAGGATVSGSWADWLNQLANTFGGRLFDDTTITLTGATAYAVSDNDFSDNAATATTMRYNVIEFDSLAQNYFTQVTVDPVSYAEQTASDIPAGQTARNYTLETYSGSASQASDLANFYLNQFSEPALAISAISVNMNDPTAQYLNNLYAKNIYGQAPIGVQVNVTFRGATYPCIIEGVEMSATPASQMVTFYLSSQELNNFLVLNNSVFGKLDENRLGFY